MRNPQQIARKAWYHATYESISLPTNRVTSRAFDGQSIWVTNNNRLSKINTLTGDLSSITIGPGPMPLGIVGNERFMWMLCTPFRESTYTLSKFNCQTTEIVQSTSLSGGTGGYHMVYDGQYIWVAFAGPRTLLKINSSDCAVVATYSLPTGSNGMEFDGNYIWNAGANGLEKINIVTGVVTPVIIPGINFSPAAMTFDGSNLWLSSVGDLIKVSLQNYSILGRYSLAHTINTLIFDGNHIWAGTQSWLGENATVFKIRASDGVIVYRHIGNSTANWGYSVFDGVHVWMCDQQTGAYVKF